MTYCEAKMICLGDVLGGVTDRKVEMLWEQL
jgi:hypothetical protein